MLAMAITVHAQQDTAKVKTKIKKDTVARSLPSPLPDLPFPTSDWDGAPLIGADATAPIYPLQKALGATKGRFRFYGWIDPGADISSSKHSNAPTSYDIFPNKVFLDQVGFKFDLQPNTVQDRSRFFRLFADHHFRH